MTFEEWFDGYAPTAPEVLDDCAKAAWDAATLAEREECAVECERMMMYSGAAQEAPAHNDVWQAAQAIRARANVAVQGALQSGPLQQRVRSD